MQDDRVPTHGDGRKLGGGDVGVLERPSFVFGAPDRLKMVPVQMEGVFAGVEVVDNDLDNLTTLEDKWVCVLAIDSGISRQVPGGQRGVQCRYFGSSIRDIVEESAGWRLEYVWLETGK